MMSLSRSMRMVQSFATKGFRNASSLVIAEVEGGAVTPATLSTVAAAKAVGGNVDIVLVGADQKDAAAAAAAVEGVSKVIVVPSTSTVAEDVTAAVLAVQKENSYSHIFASSSNFGRNVTPRIAAKLDVAPISDITKVIDESTFERPIYAGNAIATLKSKDPVKVITARSTNFTKVAPTGGSAAISEVAAPAPFGKTTFVSEERTKSDRPELTSANVVISGGRALKSEENFKILYDLADKLGGAVGASRAAVDAGYAPNDLQVGQTGKVVAPSLYIAVGISGAIQHLAGMKDSKTIVAINKDAEAPIFQVADYGLVADLFTAVPELTSKVPAK